jgi:hypothetical protein
MQATPTQEPDPRIAAFFGLVRLYGWWTALLVLGTIVVAVIVVALGKEYLLAWIKRRAGLEVDQQLAEFQGKLDTERDLRVADFKRTADTELETRRAGFATELATHTAALERKQQQFALHTGAKHRVYPELYRRMKKAEGILVRVDPITQPPPDYVSATVSQLRKYGERIGIDLDTLDEIMASLPADRGEAARRYGAAVDDRLRVRRRRACSWARNYLALNELYLSSPVALAASTVSQDMGTYERLAREDDPADRPKLIELSVRTQAALLDLRNAMQAELQAG